MKTSLTLDKITAALCEAQSSIEPAKKDATNPFFKSKYADLTSVLDVVRPVLKSQKLALTFSIGHDNSVEDAHVSVQAFLLHISGEWIEYDPFVVYCKEKNVQAQGIAITYARRYWYKSILGISEDDDDGNSISGKTEEPATKNIRIADDVSKIISRVNDLANHCDTKNELNGAIEEVKKMNHVGNSKIEASRILQSRGKQIGATFDSAKGIFV